MKLLIISDSHGLETNNEIIDYESCDAAVHLGDSQLAEDSIEMRNFNVKVRGNCDFDYNYPKSEVISFAGVRFFLTHGHYYDVNYGLAALKNEALVNKCEVALYGHTHILNVEFDDKDITLINPGSTRQSRSIYPVTYMVMEINESSFKITVKNAKTFAEIETYIVKRDR